MCNRDKPRVRRAPSGIAALVGKFYVSRSVSEFADYLQLGGTWGCSCYYFPDEDAAKQALAEVTEVPIAPLSGNIDADAMNARLAKRRQQTA